MSTTSKQPLRWCTHPGQKRYVITLLSSILMGEDWIILFGMNLLVSAIYYRHYCFQLYIVWVSVWMSVCVYECVCALVCLHIPCSCMLLLIQPPSLTLTPCHDIPKPYPPLLPLFPLSLLLSQMWCRHTTFLSPLVMYMYKYMYACLPHFYFSTPHYTCNHTYTHTHTDRCGTDL